MGPTDAPNSHLVTRERPTDEAPRGALILIHGRGADEHDLYPLFDVVDPERHLLGICPRGPLGPPGARWYDSEVVGTPEPQGFLASTSLLAKTLDARLREADLGWSRTVIGGFSQGAVMALALGLGVDRPSPAGIVALSGFLPAVAGLPLDLDARPALPVFVAHGTEDAAIDIQFGRSCAHDLSLAGLEVTYAQTPSAHCIDPVAVRRLTTWLQATIGTPPLRP